jgi:hypothetical protein
MTAIDFPNSPTVGQLFTVGDVTWEWTGSVWQGLGTAVAGPGVAAGGTDGQVLTKTSSTDYATAWEDIPESAGIVASATAPEDTNSIWFNTETGVSYIYYDDFWTSIAGSSGAPIISDTAPVDPVLGTQWFNSSTGKSYLYFSNAWIEIDSNGTSTASTGNAIINGAFEINQRGLTSSTAGGYGFDRWTTLQSGGTVTSSSQAFTLGAAPVAGFEAANFYRVVTAGQSASGNLAVLSQPIEGVRSFAGQTITVSFYAKSGAGTPKIGLELSQFFGTGGSPSARVSTPFSATISTSWTRYTATVAVPSISGKTIGTEKNDSLQLLFWISAGSDFATRASSIGIQNNTFDIWGVQLEAGPVATPFRRNANSLQGELAACQRYAFSINIPSEGSFTRFGMGQAFSTTSAAVQVYPPVTLRSAPTSITTAGTIALFDGSVFFNATSINLDTPTKNVANLAIGVASGLTQYRPYVVIGNISATASMIISAEL